MVRTHTIRMASAFAALTLVAALAVGCAQSGARGTDEVLDLLGGEDVFALISDGAAPEAYRIDGMAGWTQTADDSRPFMQAYPITAGPVPVDAESAQVLADVFTTDDTYLWDIAKACEFLPGVGYRYKRAGLEVDVLICFSCDELEVFKNGKQVGHEDFDPRRRDLVRVAKRLFADDAAIQKLK